MDPPPPAPPPSTTTSKLRLMCSYGGQITTRPNSKTLFYYGGDNRIISVDRRITTTLSSFTTHLSTTLRIQQPFLIKYQLPNQDYDSLISITTDDDLFIMFDEHDRLVNSPRPSSRLRLFLFPSKQQRSVIHSSPLDSWFSDALKSAKIMRRKNERFEDLGLGAEAGQNHEGLVHHESIVLETSSSFGSTSTSSSASSSSLPSTGVHVEENGVGLVDNKVVLPLPDSIISHSNFPSGISSTKTGVTQGSAVNVASIDNRMIASAHAEFESGISTASATQVYGTVQVSGYPTTTQMAQHQQQQQMQFVQASSHYIPNYPTGQFSNSSDFPMYPQLHHQMTHYPSTQSYPVFLLPAGQTQSYNLTPQSNLIDTGIVNASWPVMHQNFGMIPQQVHYKEVTAAPLVPESSDKVYGATPEIIPVVHLAASTQNHPQVASLQPVHQTGQSVIISSMEADNSCDKLVDDPTYSPIYKTQPPAPALPSQFQTMSGATELLLSEDFTKLQMNDVGQHLRI